MIKKIGLVISICLMLSFSFILAACSGKTKLKMGAISYCSQTKTVSWNEVANANYYVLNIEGDGVNKTEIINSKNAQTNKFEYEIQHQLIGNYIIGIIAKGDENKYLDSDIKQIKIEYEQQGILNMGMNIGGIGYYGNPTLMFNDIFLSSTNLKTESGWSNSLKVELADDGYPIGFSENEYDKRTIFLINNIYTSNYVVLYDGEGVLSFTNGITITSNTPNAIHINISGSYEHRWVTIRSSKIGNHLRNIRIIPEEYFGRENEMPLFREDFLFGLKNMSTLRFMDATKTNGSNQIYWENRAKPTDFTFETYGIPFEYLIELCNILNVNGWFCVPHKATDDYIENLAKLIKNNLNSNLTAYIEFSNEVWNTGFAQAVYVRDNAPGAADSYVSTELAKLGAVGSNLHLKSAYMMMRTFNIFENVFSGTSRSRIVTVGAIHTNNWIEYTKQTIKFWQDKNSLPDAIAGTAYFNFTAQNHATWNANPTAVTSDDVLDAVLNNWDAFSANAKQSADVINESGAQFIIYEGGQHMQPYNQGVWEYNQAVWNAQIHPKMYELYIKNYELHASLNCKLFMNFSYIGKRESQYGSWGVLESVADVYSSNLKEKAPKYQAVLDANFKFVFKNKVDL